MRPGDPRPFALRKAVASHRSKATLVLFVMPVVAPGINPMDEDRTQTLIAAVIGALGLSIIGMWQRFLLKPVNPALIGSA